MDIIEKLAKEAYQDMFFTRRPILPSSIVFHKTDMKSFKVIDASASLAQRVGTEYLQKITCNVSNSSDNFLLTFLEQNPFKHSIFGSRARKGSRIMWVIARNIKKSREKWIGRVEDGNWYPK
jgi:hypothetical protein